MSLPTAAKARELSEKGNEAKLERYKEGLAKRIVEACHNGQWTLSIEHLKSSWPLGVAEWLEEAGYHILMDSNGEQFITWDDQLAESCRSS